MKALILTCSTGEGHNSAARAMRDAFLAKNIESTIFDPLTLTKKDASKKAASAYSKIIVKSPKLFGIIYHLGEIYESTKLPTPVYAGNASYADKLYKLIIQEKYDFVVATHLFGMQAMTEVKKKYDSTIPAYGVLTDYTTIPFYTETDLDGYFVPTGRVKNMLHQKGIDMDKIHVSGIPVMKKFQEHVDRDVAKEKLGIDKNQQVVTLLSGGAGCGNMMKILKIFQKKLPENASVYVFPGKNQKLIEKLHKKFDEFKNIKIVPFTPDIDMYMKASDVILSKPGGLSSTEIAVVGIPFIHLKAIPGCETANIYMFALKGMSLPSNNIKVAVKNAVLLLKDRDLADNIVACQHEFIRKDSGDVIADTIISESFPELAESIN